MNKEIETLRADASLGAIGLVVAAILGEGGSAIVYRARDARHGRDVAFAAAPSASLPLIFLSGLSFSRRAQR